MAGTASILSGGHIIEEAYWLFEHEPELDTVKMTLGNQLQGATILHPDTPPDGQTYFKSVQNETNGVGAGQASFLEKYEKIDAAVIAFAVQDQADKAAKTNQETDYFQDGGEDDADNDNGDSGKGDAGDVAATAAVEPVNKPGGRGRKKVVAKSAGNDAYAIREWSFCDKNYNQTEPKFSGREEFKLGRAWLRKMKAAGLYAGYANMMNECCNFSDKSMDTTTIVMVNSAITNKLWDFDPGYLMAALKMAVPTLPSENTPWIFKVVADVARLDSLFVNMSENKFFQASLQPQKSPKVTTAEKKAKAAAVKDAKATKRKPGAAAKPKPAKLPTQSIKPTEPEKLLATTADGSVVLIPDDCENAIWYTLAKVPDHQVFFAQIEEAPNCERTSAIVWTPCDNTWW